MKNHLIFCPKCNFWVGAFEQDDYFQCCREKNHKIKKEVKKHDEERNKDENNN